MLDRKPDAFERGEIFLLLFIWEETSSMNLLSYEVRIYSLRRREGRKTKEKENRRVKVARGKSKRKQLQPKKKLALSLP